MGEGKVQREVVKGLRLKARWRLLRVSLCLAEKIRKTWFGAKIVCFRARTPLRVRKGGGLAYLLVLSFSFVFSVFLSLGISHPYSLMKF